MRAQLLLSQHCLAFITQGGSLIYFYIEDWQIVNEFKHVVGMCHTSQDTAVSYIHVKH